MNYDVVIPQKETKKGKKKFFWPVGTGKQIRNIERGNSMITCGVCISQRVFRSRVFTTKESLLA